MKRMVSALLCIVMLVNCLPLQVFASNVDGLEAENTLDAPVVQVPDDLPALSVEEEEAPEYMKQSLKVSWDAVSGAESYSLLLSKKQTSQWIDVLQEDAISLCTYTLSPTLFDTYGAMYRLTVSAESEGASSSAQFYFTIVEKMKSTSLLVDEKTDVQWDLSAAEKSTRTFSVESELDWTAESNVDWIICTKKGQELTVEVAENSEGVRGGEVTIANGVNSVKLTVQQGEATESPVLLYPEYSENSDNPTEIPVGGMILYFDSMGARYVGISIYEGSEVRDANKVFEGIADEDNDGYPVLTEEQEAVFKSDTDYTIVLSGHFSEAYQENEDDSDVLTRRYYVRMVEDGHKILIEGTNKIEMQQLLDFSIKLYSSGSWTWDSDVDWLQPEDYENIYYSKDYQKVEILLDPNYTENERIGTLTFRCGSETATLTVFQESWLPRFVLPENLSQDMNNPTILPYSGFIGHYIACESTYATYENDVWSEEHVWGSSVSVRHSRHLYPANFFTCDVLYRFTLQTGEYTSFYYAKFSSELREPYAVFYEDYESYAELEWSIIAGESNRQVEISTSGAWSISSDASWLSVSSTSGTTAASNSEITIISKANTTGTERVGTLTIISEGKALGKLRVKQAAQDYLVLMVRDDDLDYRVYDPETSGKNLDGSGDTVVLMIWTNAEDTCSITSSVDWITLKKDTWITLEENNTGSMRSGTVTITCGKASETITVTQVPMMEMPALVSPDISVDYKNPSAVEHGDIQMTWKAIEGAVRYEINVVPNDKSLCTESVFHSFETVIQETGTEIYSCTIPATAFSINNEKYDYIKLYAYDAWGYYVYEVYYLIPTKGEAAVIKGSTTPVWDNATDIEVSQTFLVRSTSNWTAECDYSWISIDKASGADGDNLTVSLSKNYGTARTGYVYVTVGTATTVLTVNQCAYLPEFPAITSPVFSDDPVEPTIVAADTSQIHVTWDYEPQAEYYKISLLSFKSNTVQHIEATSPELHADEYTFTNLSLVAGQRYCIRISRKSHWGPTARMYYFTLSDENAFVLVDDVTSLELLLDGDEDYNAVDITSSGVWAANVSDSWILVDNERIQQEDLDAEGYTAEEYGSFSGKSGERLYVSVLENSTNAYRYGTVTVRCADAEAVITVVQEPYYELAEITSPALAETYREALSVPMGNLSLQWTKPVGGTGKCDLVLYECYEGTSKGEEIYTVTDLSVTSLTIPERYFKEGYYYKLRLETQLDDDPENNRGTTYYFYVQYKNALVVSANVDWSYVATQDMVVINASASGGSGEYKYAYELLCNGVQRNITPLEKLTYYSFPIEGAGTYQVRVSVQDSSGTSASALSEKYTVEESIVIDQTPPRTTWDSGAQNIWIGEEFAFAGMISSQNKIDKVHVTISRADGVNNSIDYYRAENCNSETFDMTNIPSFVVGDVLKGLKVTNDQETLSVYSGAYIIRLWVTDCQGISNGGVAKTITVNAVEESTAALPTVVLQTATAETVSTVKLQAKVTDLKDGIISQFGFNLYRNADDSEPFVVYTKADGVSYSTIDNTFYYYANSLDLSTGLYAEAFAVYYQNENEMKGISERLYVAPKSSAITFTSPVSNAILGEDMLVTVSGYVRPTPIKVLIFLYDAAYNELNRYVTNLTMEGVFDTQFSMENYREIPGTYYIQAVCNMGGSVVNSQYVSIVVPGGIDIQVQPVAGSTVGVSDAVVEANFQEYEDKQLTDYGIYLYENMTDVTPIARYSKAYKNGGTFKFNTSTGVLSVTAVGLSACKRYYAEAFAVYSNGSAEIVSVSENRQSFTTRAVSASITTPQNNSIVEDNSISVSGSVINRSTSVNVTAVKVYLKNGSGSVVSSHNAVVSGNGFSVTIDTSGVAAGKYTVQAQVSSDDGYVAYTASRSVQIAAPITGVGLYNYTESYHMPDGDQLTIARGYHTVVQVLAEPDISAIKNIEWIISDKSGISVTEWANNYKNSHPHTYQINALKEGNYTLTVIIHNYDGSSIQTTINITVNLLTLITVIDYYSMKPVQQARVAIEGYEKTFTTDDAGQVFIYDITSDSVRNIGISNISTLEVQETIQIKAGKSNLVFTYSGKPIQRVKLTERYTTEDGDYEYNYTDLLKQKAILDYMDKKLELKIEVQAQESFTISKYQLVQNGQVVKSSTTGVFDWFNTTAFTENGGIFVRVVYANGGYREEKINLSFYRTLWDGSVGMSETAVSFGKKLEISFPDDSPLAGQKLSVDLSNMPINVYRTTDNKLQMAIGFKEVFKANKDKLSVSQDYLDLFASCKKFIETAQTKGLETAHKSAHIKGLVSSDIKEDFSWTNQIEGKPTAYLWAEYDMRKHMISFTIAAQFKYSLPPKEYQIPVSFPLVVCANAEIGSEIKLTVNDRQLSNQDAANQILEEIFEFISGQLIMSFHFKAGIGGGIGYANAATVTANASAKLEGVIQFPTTDTALTLTGQGFFRVKVLAFEHIMPFYDKKWTLHDSSGENTQSTEPVSLMSFYNMPLSSFEPADRSYAEDTSDWYETKEDDRLTLMSTATQYDVSDVKTLMSSIYPDTQLQSIETEQDRVMVWLTDDTTREANNRTKLVYSVFDVITGKWSVPQSVYDDGTLDSSPRIATDGENIYVAWVNLNQAFSEEMTLENALLNTEICVAAFDTNTKSFTAVETLTNDSGLDSNPSICMQDNQVIVAWTKNSEGDIWGARGTNTIYVATCSNGIWTSAEPVKEFNGLLSEVETGFLQGESYVAYSVDEDNSSATIEDVQLYLMKLNTKSEQAVGELGLNGGLQFVSMNGEQILTWNCNGTCVYINEEASHVEELSSTLTGMGDFRLISNDNGAVLLQRVDNEAGSELYASVYTEATDVWSGLTRLTYQDKGYINDYTAFLNADNEVELVFTCENNGIANMYTGGLKPIENISFDQFALENNEALDEKSVIGYATVTNHGLTTVERINFSILDGGNLLSESLVDVEIRAGETSVIAVPVQIPDVDEVKTFNVQASVEAIEEATLTDNKTTFKLGYTDLAIGYKEYLGEGTRMLEFTVTNESGYASGATINLYENNKYGTVLGTLRIENIEAKSYITKNIVLQATDTKVYIEVVADCAEADLNDNTAQYLMVTDETLNPDTSVMTVASISSSSAQLYLDNDQAGICIVAIYDSNNKMMTCGQTSVEAFAGDTTVSYMSFANSGSYTVKIFFVNEEYMPLYESVVIEY